MHAAEPGGQSEMPPSPQFHVAVSRSTVLGMVKTTVKSRSSPTATSADGGSTLMEPMPGGTGMGVGVGGTGVSVGVGGGGVLVGVDAAGVFVGVGGGGVFVGVGGGGVFVGVFVGIAGSGVNVAVGTGDWKAKEVREIDTSAGSTAVASTSAMVI